MLLPQSPEQQRNQQHQEFAGQWIPFFLYYSDYTLLSPFSLERICTLPEGVCFQALATTPAHNSFVYCVEKEDRSLLVLQWLGEGSSSRVIDSTDLPSDLRFHAPMSLSQDRRWLLANAVREGPLPANEVWIIDVTGTRAPECILPATEFVKCLWSPVGTVAACLTRRADETKAVVLVDPDGLRADTLVIGEGSLEWSLDGSSLRVYLSSGDVIAVDFASRRQERYSSAAGTELGCSAVRSPDLSVVASVVPTGRGGRIRIRPLSGGGSGRVASAPAGVDRLLAWSAGGELLAYAGNDSVLHFCSGAVSDVGYERLMGAYPTTPGGVDPEQLIQSARDGMALETRISPLRLESSGSLLFGWARSSTGPCFVYADEADGAWHLNALQFRKMSLSDLGLEPEADHATELLEVSGLDNMETVAQALRSYALDHEGLLPPHGGGADLERELAPYLDYAGRLHALSSPGKVSVRLLVPGESIRDLTQQIIQHPGKRIRIAETLPEENRVFVIEACTLEDYYIGPGTFPYEVFVEYR